MCIHFVYLNRTDTVSKQEGPKGPGSLIWEKVQRSSEAINLYMKQYTKYQSFEPCSFKQEDYWTYTVEKRFWHRDLLMQPIRTI